MNFTFTLRVLLLVAAFAIPFLEPEAWSGVHDAELGYFIFVGFVFLGSAAVSFFAGCMKVIFSQRRELPRPSLRAPLLFGRSPVQFFWYAGLLSVSVGVGAIVRHLAHGFSFEGLVLIAVGLGLLSGSVLTLKKMARHFFKHEKQSI